MNENSIFEALKSNSIAIRKQIAENANTSIELLEVLAKDKFWEVRVSE